MGNGDLYQIVIVDGGFVFLRGVKWLFSISELRGRYLLIEQAIQRCIF